MQSPVRYERGRIHVDGEMTVYTCSDLKARLFAARARLKTALGQRDG